MAGDTDVNGDGARNGAARPPGRHASAWGVFRFVISIAILVYLYVRGLNPEVRDRDAMRRGKVEQIQSLRSGSDTYTLLYHRSGGPANTVTKNGERVFDSRNVATQGCIRLIRRDNGRIELECLDAKRKVAIFFPLP